MNIKEFMDYEDGIEKYVEVKLDEIADCFYQFAHEFYSLSKIDSAEECLKNSVADEYNGENGVLKKHFNVIYKLEDKLEKIEKDVRKNEEDFNPDESMVSELRAEYQDLIQNFSKKMFLYGAKFGGHLRRKI